MGIKTGKGKYTRRRMPVTIAVMAAAYFLSACGKVKGENMVLLPSDRHIQPETPAVGEKDNDLQLVTDYSQNIRTFGYALFAQGIHDKNPVLSPVSVYLALSMAGDGAEGATRGEFQNVLGKDMMAVSGDVMGTLPTKGEVLNLSIAGSVWLDDKFIADDAWLDTAGSVMGADIFQAELSTEKTMDDINSWVNRQTNGLVDRMLSAPLDQSTQLALFNTVYFKGKWEIPFDAGNTYKDVFYQDRERSITGQADMMHMYGADLSYIANDFAEGIILPYQRDSSDGKDFVLVQQKVKIIVDEEGTEAAAVTGILMTDNAITMEPQKPKEVYFDEPFVYMIMDMEKEIPLFVGIMDDPG